MAKRIIVAVIIISAGLILFGRTIMIKYNIYKMSRDNPMVRSRAEVQLIKYGIVSLPYLESAIRGGNNKVYESCVGWITKYGKLRHAMSLEESMYESNIKWED